MESQYFEKSIDMLNELNMFLLGRTAPESTDTQKQSLIKQNQLISGLRNLKESKNATQWRHVINNQISSFDKNITHNIDPYLTGSSNITPQDRDRYFNEKQKAVIAKAILHIHLANSWSDTLVLGGNLKAYKNIKTAYNLISKNKRALLKLTEEGIVEEGIVNSMIAESITRLIMNPITQNDESKHDRFSDANLSHLKQAIINNISNQIGSDLSVIDPLFSNKEYLNAIRKTFDEFIEDKYKYNSETKQYEVKNANPEQEALLYRLKNKVKFKSARQNSESTDLSSLINQKIIDLQQIEALRQAIDTLPPPLQRPQPDEMSPERSGDRTPPQPSSPPQEPGDDSPPAYTSTAPVENQSEAPPRYSKAFAITNKPALNNNHLGIGNGSTTTSTGINLPYPGHGSVQYTNNPNERYGYDPEAQSAGTNRTISTQASELLSRVDNQGNNSFDPNDLNDLTITMSQRANYPEQSSNSTSSEVDMASTRTNSPSRNDEPSTLMETNSVSSTRATNGAEITDPEQRYGHTTLNDLTSVRATASQIDNSSLIDELNNLPSTPGTLEGTNILTTNSVGKNKDEKSAPSPA